MFHEQLKLGLQIDREMNILGKWQVTQAAKIITFLFSCNQSTWVSSDCVKIGVNDIL